MPIRLNVAELHAVLKITPRDQNVLLVGTHGIGKSEILRDFYRSEGLGVTPLFLGQMADPGDLLGLPHKDPTTGRTVFLPPSFWPTKATPIALFLDELNRARPEVLQAVHELALDRTLAGRRLPAGSTVLAAVNLGEDYQVTDLDPALASRFNIYEFAPEVDEWLAWATTQQLDPRVVAFITESPGHLDGVRDKQRTDLDRTPDRRAWTRVARMVRATEEIDELVTKAIGGVVGVEAAVAFHKHCSRKGRLSGERVLNRWNAETERALDRLTVPELVPLNREILQWLEHNARELAPKKLASVLAAAERYVDYLGRVQRTEAIADLVGQLDKPHFARASAILLDSSTMLAKLERYIERVKL